MHILCMYRPQHRPKVYLHIPRRATNSTAVWTTYVGGFETQLSVCMYIHTHYGGVYKRTTKDDIHIYQHVYRNI